MAKRPVLARSAAVAAPALTGAPITVRFLPGLTSHRGKLLSGKGAGQVIHAAAFLRRREIVLDSGLKRDRAELERILTHEIFHFAWARLANGVRWGYEELLAGELRRGAPGELGWSSESRKRKVTPRDAVARTRRWRQYACESFCDTAAYLFALAPGDQEHLLPGRCRRDRKAWFEAWFETAGPDHRISV